MKPLRVTTYARLSLTVEGQTGLDRQEADMLQEIERNGWVLVEQIRDDGKSGAKDRANLNRAIKQIVNNETDVLMVWKMDRFSRQGISALVPLFDAMEARKGTRFISIKDGLDSSQPGNRMIMVMQAELARSELENYRLRASDNRVKKLESGVYSGGRVHYGYKATGPKGKRTLVVDKAEAAIILESAQKLLEGHSMYSVVQDLNNRGVRTKQGAMFSPERFRRIMVSPTLLGYVVRDGKVFRGPDGKPVKAWEQLIPEEMHYRLVKRLEKTPYGRKKRRAARLLSGIVRCNGCKTTMNVCTYGPSSKGTVNYVCRAKAAGKVCPAPAAMSCKHLDNYAEQLFLEQFGDREHMIMSALDSNAVRKAEINAVLDDLYSSIKVAEGSERREIQQKMSDLWDELETLPEQTENRMISTGKTLAQLWEEGDLKLRQTLLRETMPPMFIGRGKSGVKGFQKDRVTFGIRPVIGASNVLTGYDEEDLQDWGGLSEEDYFRAPNHPEDQIED